jgi:acyl dehydratase
VTRRIHVDDLPRLVGAVLGESEPLEVTQEQVNLFADATHDHQWLHVDPVRAAEGPFGGTIAHGFLTLALLPALFERTVTLEGAETFVNYGLNRLRFPAPVLVGSTVRLKVSLNDVKEVPGGVELALGFEIGEPGAAKPAAVGESLLRAYPDGHL